MAFGHGQLTVRYQFLIRLLAPVFFFALWWRGRREPAWRQGWGQRLGRVARRTDRPLWIHVASVGEANSALSFLSELQARHPALPVYLTAFTPSGAARLKEIAPRAEVGLLPLDLGGLWRKFLEALGPRAVVVLETECWPNLLRVARQKNIPVLWLSGRLGVQSTRRLPQLFGAQFLRQALAGVAHFGVQTPADLERFTTLGVSPEKISVTGSLKFDLSVPEGLVEQAGRWRREHAQRRPIWLAASTHPGEEEAVLQAHQQLRAIHPRALLVLAPRHPRRSVQIMRLIQRQGLDAVLHSGAQPLGEAAVLLIDSLGQLLWAYAVAEVAFVGGSLVPVGGHNLLEPAALARPILTGPHLDSCRDIATALEQAQALIQVDAAPALGEQLLHVLAEPEQARRMGAAGQQFAARNQGAVARSLKLLEPWL